MRLALLCSGALLAGCHVSVGGPATPTPNAATEGAVVVSDAFTIEAGVADVRLKVGGSDSLRWSIYTHPKGCAEAKVTSRRLGTDNRRNRCAVEWEISMPAVRDVKIDVSVGDIDVTAPSDRAVELQTNVGSVRVRLDDRLMRHENAPGSGDKLTIGEPRSLPRLVAHTSVGDVRLELKTPAGRSP